MHKLYRRAAQLTANKDTQVDYHNPPDGQAAATAAFLSLHQAYL